MGRSFGGKVRGPGGSNEEGGMSVRREDNLTPQKPYEETGSIPTPTWGGRARMTRDLGKMGSAGQPSPNQQETEPRYEAGPKRTFKRTT